MSNLVAMQEIEIMEKVFELEQRKAKAMITSQILPSNFRNIGDVIVLNEMSRNLQIPVILLAQQLYIVHGKVGFSGQFAIALLNKAVELGKLDKWEYETKDKAVRVVGSKGEEKRAGIWIDEELVKKNGWTSNSHWKNNFDLMAHYRAATWFLRTNFPELLMGMHSTDEIQDGVIEPEIERETNHHHNNNGNNTETAGEKTIDPLELAKAKTEKGIKMTDTKKEPEKITVDSFREFYKGLNKEQKAAYLEYSNGVDLSKLSEEEFQKFYKGAKEYVGA